MPIKGNSFNLVQQFHMLAMALGKDAKPMQISGKNLETTRKRLPCWHESLPKKQLKGNGYGPIPSATPTQSKALSMGHSIEVHRRSYRTTDWS